ncbi:MAG: hypothetical protein U0T82_02840 [Bacteroidales bacterium]
METKLRNSSVLSYTFFLLAILTLIPVATASPNLAGYHTLCAFAPASTIYLLGAGLFYRDRVRRIRAWIARQALKSSLTREKVAA